MDHSLIKKVSRNSILTMQIYKRMTGTTAKFLNSVHVRFFLEWVELRFTEVGFPLLARRARLPALIAILLHTYYVVLFFIIPCFYLLVLFHGIYLVYVSKLSPCNTR